MFFKLALSGFLRYKKKLRNLTIALSVIYFLCFFFLSLFTSLNRNLNSYWVGNYVGGDLIVSSSEEHFDLTKPVIYENYIDYKEFLRKNSHLKDMTSPRIRISASLEADNMGEGVTRPLITTGVDYERERELNDFLKITRGRMVRKGKKEIVIPLSVASELGVSIGDPLYIFTTTVDLFSNAEKLEVVGYYETVNAAGFAFGNYYGFIDLQVAKELIQSNMVSELVSYSKSGRSLSSGYVQRDSIEVISVSRTIKAAYNIMYYAVVALLLFFCIGVILQNVTMMNEERRSEIAVYLTYGAKPVWIGLFMYGELLFYLIYCSLIGALFSVAANFWLNSLGLYPVDIFSEILLGGEELLLTRAPIVFIKTWITLTLVTFLAAFYPICRSVTSLNIITLFKR